MNNNDSEVATGKEAYEAKKREKEASRSKRSQTEKVKTGSRKALNIIIALVIIAAIIGGIFWWLSTLGPKGDDLSRRVPVLGQEHIPEDSPRPDYNSNPPTSGPHYGTPARGGFRTERIADEHIVHSLEHGFVWISYQPDVPAAVIEELKSFEKSNVIITERAANDTDIALAAWGRLDAFNLPAEGTVDTERISDFIKRYLNHGPERVSNHGGV